MNGLVVLVAVAWLLDHALPAALRLALILLNAWVIHWAWRTARAYDREVDLDREAERVCLIIRADYENQMYLRGDPVGTYGHYTPPTLPLTRPLPTPGHNYAEPRDWYDYEPRNPYHLYGGMD